MPSKQIHNPLANPHIGDAVRSKTGKILEVVDILNADSERTIHFTIDGRGPEGIVNPSQWARWCRVHEAEVITNVESRQPCVSS